MENIEWLLQWMTTLDAREHPDPYIEIMNAPAGGVMASIMWGAAGEENALLIAEAHAPREAIEKLRDKAQRKEGSRIVASP